MKPKLGRGCLCCVVLLAGCATESRAGGIAASAFSALIGGARRCEASPTSWTDIWFLLAVRRPEFRGVQRVGGAQLLQTGRNVYACARSCLERDPTLTLKPELEMRNKSLAGNQKHPDSSNLNSSSIISLFFSNVRPVSLPVSGGRVSSYAPPC